MLSNNLIDRVVENVSDYDKQELLAYISAYHRKRVSSKYFYLSYGEDQKNSDELVIFSTRMSARKTDKIIFNSFINDLLQDADLVNISPSLDRWEFITGDADITKAKVNSWASYFNIQGNLYFSQEKNNSNNKWFLRCNLYRIDNIPMMKTNSGWYVNQGIKLKTLDQKLAAAYQHGFLLSNNKSPHLIRSRAASVHDVEFMEKLISFNIKHGQKNSFGLKNDLKNTINRFAKNYNWPNKQVLVNLI
jgi:hypothetical protein